MRNYARWIFAAAALCMIPAFVSAQSPMDDVEVDAGVGVFLPVGVLGDIATLAIGVSGRGSVPVMAGLPLRLFAEAGITYNLLQDSGSGILDIPIGVGATYGISVGAVDLRVGASYGLMPHLTWGDALSSDGSFFLDQYAAFSIESGLALSGGSVLVVRPTYRVYFEQESTLGQLIGAVIAYRL